MQAAKSEVGGDEQAIRAEAERIRAAQHRQQQQVSDQGQQQLTSEQQEPQPPETAADVSGAAATVLEAAGILEDHARLEQLDAEAANMEAGTPDSKKMTTVNLWSSPSCYPMLSSIPSS
jgi:hypothetical protein